jgi:hypothetical protein
MWGMMNKRLLFGYLGATLFLLIASRVYLQFVPGVSNFFMETAFLYPLFAGIFEVVLQKKLQPFSFTKTSFRLGITTLSVVSFIQGVLEIALASHPLVEIMWLVGITVTLISVVFLIARFIDKA